MSRSLPLLALVVPLAFGLAGCRQDMHDQPRYKPLAATDFFGDGRSARPPVEGTVARGQLRIDTVRYTGKLNGKDVDEFPFPITRADLDRGRERFNIYCSPCHSRVGDGNGMIVLRGYRQAASYHTEKLLKAPVGHFFDVMTNGFGAMPRYATRIVPDDRWRIAAYIRVLQFSENASLADVPADQRAAVDQGMITPPPPAVPQGAAAAAASGATPAAPPQPSPPGPPKATPAPGAAPARNKQDNAK